MQSVQPSVTYCTKQLVMRTPSQSCPWVHFMWPSPTQPVACLTQPNPIERQSHNWRGQRNKTWHTVYMATNILTRNVHKFKTTKIENVLFKLMTFNLSYWTLHCVWYLYALTMDLEIQHSTQPNPWKIWKNSTHPDPIQPNPARGLTQPMDNSEPSYT